MPTNHKIPSKSSISVVDSSEGEEYEVSPSGGSESSVSSEETERGESEEYQEAGNWLFSPSLSSQRHSRVLEILQADQVSSLLDTGCNDCRFLNLAKELPSLSYLAGVDIDRHILEVNKFKLQPLAADYLAGRKGTDLVVQIWAGDVTDQAGAAVMEGRVEAVTSIEIIEHLHRPEVAQFSRAVLGVVRPRVWVVTTPNRDYNILFPDWVPGQMRHWDHKFEWSRDQMRRWAERVVVEHPEYEAEYDGVGWTEGCRESHGPASQFVIFRRPDWTPSDRAAERVNSWELLSSNTFPANQDTRSRQEKIFDELVYYANIKSYDEFLRMSSTEPYEVNDQEIVIKFQDILQFDSLMELEATPEELREIVIARGEKTTEEGILISLNKFIPDDSEEEEEDDY